MKFFGPSQFGRFTRHLTGLTLVLLGPALPLPATQTNAPVTIFLNGPTNNRVNLVFLAEGYQTNQFGQFLADATNAANNFLAVEPYAEYSSSFNAFAIAVSSTNSGSSNPEFTANTYFSSSYLTYSYNNANLITIPASGSGQGQDRVTGLLTTYFGTTNNFLPVVLVNNDPNYPGGSDNGGTAAVTDSSASSLATIFIHETGHTLGNLGDEYSSPLYTNYPNVEEPNTTTNTNNIKWSAWIPTNTPLPTPPTSAYFTTVGLFLGAHYHTNGWYRPWEACIMQNQANGNGFCPVCTEALVLAIYGKCRPIDSFTPATNKITTASAQKINFSLTLVSPATHPLNVQWRTNGVAVPGATNAAFSLAPMQTGTQTNSVAAVVWDNTPMVRNDPKNLLWQTNTWTVVTTLPALQLDTAQWTMNHFSFRVTGSSPDGVVVLGSSNLTSWLPLQTNLFGSQTNFFYTNLGANLPWRFYRAVTPP